MSVYRTIGPLVRFTSLLQMDFFYFKIYNKRDEFDFDIVNFPFLDGNVPRRASYGASYISQLIRFARVAAYWEIAAHSAYDMFCKYKYHIVNSGFSHLGFRSGSFFLIAAFSDHCLLVPFYEEIQEESSLKVARRNATKTLSKPL